MVSNCMLNSCKQLNSVFRTNYEWPFLYFVIYFRDGKVEFSAAITPELSDLVLKKHFLLIQKNVVLLNFLQDILFFRILWYVEIWK